MKHRLRKKISQYANSPYAIWMLILLSFLESCISPISPLILLIPMVMIKPEKAWTFAVIATIAATVGSIVGYYLGYLGMDAIEPLIVEWGYGAAMKTALHWLHEWGLWALLIASIFPIPYKLFAIAVGASKMNIFVFILTSACVRFFHFALIPICFMFFKDLIIKWFHKKVD